MKRLLLILTGISLLLVSPVYGGDNNLQPAPVFTLEKSLPTVFETGPNPQVVFTGDKMFFFGGLKDVAIAFKEKTGIDVGIYGFGCKLGAETLIAGRSTMAGQCRVQDAPFEKKSGDIKRWPVARYSLVVFVNKSNPVNNLTLNQIEKINSGEITNWKEVGGSDEPIIVVEPAHCYCKHPTRIDEGQIGPELLRLPRGKWTGNRIKAYSQFVVVELVSMIPNAIAAEKLPFIDTDKVKPISVNGIYPSKENILNGKYPVLRVMTLLTRPGVNKETLQFIKFAQSDEGQAILHGRGLVRYYR